MAQPRREKGIRSGRKEAWLGHPTGFRSVGYPVLLLIAECSLHKMSCQMATSLIAKTHFASLSYRNKYKLHINNDLIRIPLSSAINLSPSRQYSCHLGTLAKRSECFLVGNDPTFNLGITV